MFLDKVTINIRAGAGGNGHISFYRDKLKMTGPPDGGDGGNGGDVIFVGSTREDNLVNFRFTKKFHAGNGVHGRPGNRTGARGEPIIIPVPLGTRIYKINKKESDGLSKSRVGVSLANPSKELLADITQPDQQFVALCGGSGGRGNAFYATGKKRSPNFSQMGVSTKDYDVRLELNSIADIGLVGFPNVGKSTLLAAITRANPKIANYPFTTLHPNIGVANVFGQNIIVADIPGLIEGASEGIGLGHDFLKHLRRTRLLVHVVDISETEGRTATDDFRKINAELKQFSADLAAKPQIVALNKVDMATEKQIKQFVGAAICRPLSHPPFPISAAIGEGVNELMQHAAKILATIPKPESCAATATLEGVVDKNAFTVEVVDGEYHVTGALVDNLIRGVVLTDTESNHYFQRRLLETGIIDELKKRGMVEGDVVIVGSVEFEYLD